VNIQDLRKSPLFEGLTDDELQHLMDNAKPVSLRAGEVLMKQGGTWRYSAYRCKRRV
jgi:hypothetical protein